MDWEFKDKDALVHKGTNTVGGIIDSFPIGCRVLISESFDSRSYTSGKTAKVVGHSPTGALACYNPEFWNGHTAYPYFKHHPEHYNDCYDGKVHWISATAVEKLE